MFPIVQIRWKIRREIEVAEAKFPGKTYSYLEAQAKCPPYAGDTDDFMELVLSLGFVMMFSVIMPLMALLALLSNLLEMRLLAYRMTNVNQRPAPRGQEGIGAWQSI